MDNGEYAELIVSEDLVESPAHKTSGITTVDFNGALSQPLLLHEDLKEGCGGQLWPAGMALAHYLLSEPRRSNLSSKRILELGAGSGLVGLSLAQSFRSSEDASAHIEITDQAPLIHLMEHNIALNRFSEQLVGASILNWGSPMWDRAFPDAILAADCVYFEPAFPLLLDTMLQLIGPETTCFFCFKKRRRADLRFITELRKNFGVMDINNHPESATWTRDNIFLYEIREKDLLKEVMRC